MIAPDAGSFALLSLPAVFLPAVVVTVSNLRLMRKEGWSWRNMLGAILGGLLCLGIAAEGIGSPTKSYFRINAFIREFVATLHMERKAHLRIVALLVAMAALMVGLIYINNNR